MCGERGKNEECRDLQERQPIHTTGDAESDAPWFRRFAENADSSSIFLFRDLSDGVPAKCYRENAFGGYNC